MAFVTTWKVSLDAPHEVRAEIHLTGRDVVKLDGQVVSDSWGQKFRRRVPVPIGAGHTAGIEIDVRRLWPICTLSVDGATIAPATRPRVPLWAWAFAFLCVLSCFVPRGEHSAASFVATRAIVSALGMWIAIFLGADERKAFGFVVGVLMAAGAWAFALYVR